MSEQVQIVIDCRRQVDALIRRYMSCSSCEYNLEQIMLRLVAFINIYQNQANTQIEQYLAQTLGSLRLGSQEQRSDAEILETSYRELFHHIHRQVTPFDLLGGKASITFMKMIGSNVVVEFNHFKKGQVNANAGSAPY